MTIRCLPRDQEVPNTICLWATKFTTAEFLSMPKSPNKVARVLVDMRVAVIAGKHGLVFWGTSYLWQVIQIFPFAVVAYKFLFKTFI